LPLAGTNSVRNLVASSIVATTLLMRPLLALNPGPQVVTMAPPVRHAFKSLRSCAYFVLGAWCVEALLYSECGNEDAHMIHALRHGILVVAFLGMVVSSTFRIAFPTSTSDVHVALSLGFLVLLVCAPQSQYYTHNPLARHLSFADGLVRAIRVTLFSTTYCATVLCAAPRKIFELEPLVLSVRAFATTSWVLVCPPTLLFAQPIFLTALCVQRVRAEGGDEQEPIVVSGVYATGVSLDLEESRDTNVNTNAPTNTNTNTNATARHTNTNVATHTISEERKRVLLNRLQSGGS
jgi:hypothetical protein